MFLDGVAILNSVVREVFTDKVPSEQRSTGSERVSQGYLCQKIGRQGKHVQRPWGELGISEEF